MPSRRRPNVDSTPVSSVLRSRGERIPFARTAYSLWSRAEARDLLLAFVLTRLAIAGVMISAAVMLTPAECRGCVDASPQPLLAAFSRWDSVAYVAIARDGYVVPEHSSFLAYSPLYPLVMRIVGALLGGSDDALIVAGVLISNAALAVALVGLFRLGSRQIGAVAARRALLAVLIFPTTLFTISVYPTSLWLALAVWSAVEAERARWWRSGTLAALAALVRPFGVLAVVPLAYAWLRSRRPRSAGLSVLLAPLAFAAWSTFQWMATGDPLETVHVYSAWDIQPQLPFAPFGNLFDRTQFGFPWFHIAMFGISVALVLASWRVLSSGLAAFATLMLLVIASKDPASSMRYEIELYPAFLVLGTAMARAPFRVVWIGASATLAVIFAAMFSMWLWVG